MSKLGLQNIKNGNLTNLYNKNKITANYCLLKKCLRTHGNIGSSYRFKY
jgi:hypothetical protein